MAGLTVNGRRVYFHDGGVPWEARRPHVVLVHGAGMDHTVWQQQSRALAHHGFNVAAPDLPGHGGSEDMPGLDTVDGYTAWLAEFMAAAGIGRAALVGSSLGAGIAVTLAAREPGRVGALVLVGTALQMPVSPALLEDTRHDPPGAADFITAHAHGRPSHLGGAPTPGNWLLGTARALVGACPAEVLHRDFAACDAWDGAPLAAEVRAPTLVVAGSGDRMTPARGARALADAIAGARFELLPGAGHMIPTEQPRAFLKLLREFLAGAG